jgi:hypothetical protein
MSTGTARTPHVHGNGVCSMYTAVALMCVNKRDLAINLHSFKWEQVLLAETRFLTANNHCGPVTTRTKKK